MDGGSDTEPDVEELTRDETYGHTFEVDHRTEDGDQGEGEHWAHAGAKENSAGTYEAAQITRNVMLLVFILVLC